MSRAIIRHNQVFFYTLSYNHFLLSPLMMDHGATFSANHLQTGLDVSLKSGRNKDITGDLTQGYCPASHQPIVKVTTQEEN